ncbi:unnamed protein product [Arctia plantaginis]|uniref:Uncharacterized protein n=1 Tax=Arctia plantaginis TaxID=874455 RepID=A0A8S0ZVY4_ARCPL|nr:unnamed protein product [Arctia plantaginis]CAB3238949.1 unnamed protein product [Arctia plantaginis]
MYGKLSSIGSIDRYVNLCVPSHIHDVQPVTALWRDAARAYMARSAGAPALHATFVRNHFHCASYQMREELCELDVTKK